MDVHRVPGRILRISATLVCLHAAQLIFIAMTSSPAAQEDPGLERSFRGHKDAVTSVAFNPNMKQLVSGSLDNCLMVWNFKPQLRAFRFAGHQGPVYTVAFSPSEALIASGSKDRTVRLWHPTVEGRSTVLKAHTNTVRSVAFSGDGSKLLTASDDKTVKVWSVTTQKFMFTLSGHMNWVRSCQVSPDGRLAVSGGDDRTVKVWDLQSKKVIRSYEDVPGLINTVAFHPDSTCVACGGTDQGVALWDLRSDQMLQKYAAHTAAVTNLSFHPTGNFLITSSLDTTLKVWDLREGQLFYTLHGHEGATLGVAFSPAGEYFASGGADEQVLVWKTNFDRFLVNQVSGPVEKVQQAEGHEVQDGKRADQGKTISRGSGPARSSLVPTKAKGARAVTRSGRSTTVRQSGESLGSHEAFAEPPSGHSNPEEDLIGPPPSVEEGTSMNVMGMSEAVASSLQHIVGQLDIITQTLVALDQRLTVNEDHVQRLEHSLATFMGNTTQPSDRIETNRSP